MATITVIPATKHTGFMAGTEKAPKLRVAAYCRVSTESEEQATSYEAQVSHYTEYISRNQAWQFAGIYADDGISGTNTKHRDDFNRLITDCLGGRIDMVVTKSISRFARNTLDCLKYIRQLKERNIAVFFEKEGINTLDAKGEVLLTIMASLAQQESQSLSQNVKLGLQYRYQQGKVQVNTKRFLGYDKDENGNLVINPEEAEVVKRIYREYLEGKSLIAIARGLSADGIRTAAGNEHWLDTTVRKILLNEKYIGDALLQKTVTTDFLTKRRIKNKGIAPQYYVEGNHEPIIPKELYMMVREEMARRGNLRTTDGRKRTYCSKFALSGIVICGHCGEIFRRTHYTRKNGTTIVWRCLARMEKKERGTDCPARTISEPELHAVIVQAVNEVFANQNVYLRQLKENIIKVVGEYNSGPVAEVDARISALQKELLKKTRADRSQDYDDIGLEIRRLREEKYQLQLEDAGKAGHLNRIRELETILDGLDGEVKEYDDALTRRLIEKITVYDDRYTVEFKSGIEIDIKG